MKQDTAVTISTMDNSEQKCNKWWKIATAIASTIAICGIGFGIYGIMQSTQKDNQISNLKAQVEETSNKTAAPKTETGATADNDVVISTTENNSAKDYIYISEWGIKIKVPKADRFREFSYAFTSNALYLWGAKTTESPQATTAFGTLGDWDGRIVNNAFLGKVSRMSAPNAFFSHCEAVGNCGIKIAELDDGSALVWFDSESAMSAYGDQQSYDGQLQESISILKTHFINPDNYSTL